MPSSYPPGTSGELSVAAPKLLPNFIVLTQLNVWQATLINSIILGIASFFSDDPGDRNDQTHKICYDTEEDLAYKRSYLSPQSKTHIPSSLAPTPLQKTIPHFPWIDLFPSPNLRDNIIRAGAKLDVHEFCADMMGSMFGTADGSVACGLRVWGDSWSVESWEMTEGFVVKWGWLLCGCEELVRATNRWRLERGEDELVVN